MNWDPRTRELTDGGRARALGPREGALFNVLLARRPRFLTPAELELATGYSPVEVRNGIRALWHALSGFDRLFLVRRGAHAGRKYRLVIDECSPPAAGLRSRMPQAASAKDENSECASEAGGVAPAVTAPSMPSARGVTSRCGCASAAPECFAREERAA